MEDTNKKLAELNIMTQNMNEHFSKESEPESMKKFQTNSGDQKLSSRHD